MSQKSLEQLVMSLYSFVKNEADNTRKEFVYMHAKFDEIDERFRKVDERFDEMEKRFDARFDTLEKIPSNHENRITNIEDSSRVIKTKLGLV